MTRTGIDMIRITWTMPDDRAVHWLDVDSHEALPTLPPQAGNIIIEDGDDADNCDSGIYN